MVLLLDECIDSFEMTTEIASRSFGSSGSSSVGVGGSSSNSHGMTNETCSIRPSENVKAIADDKDPSNDRQQRPAVNEEELCYINLLPIEILQYIVTMASGHPDESAFDNQRVLISIQSVCQRWFFVASPLLIASITCVNLRQAHILDHLFRHREIFVPDVIAEGSENDKTAVVEATRTMPTPRSNRGVQMFRRVGEKVTNLSILIPYDRQHKARYFEVWHNIVADLLDTCRNVRILELRVPANDYRICKVLARALSGCRNIEQFVWSSSPQDDARLHSENELIIITPFSNLTHLTLSSLFQRIIPSSELLDITSPRFKLRVLHIGTWHDWKDFNWPVVDWLLEHSQDSLREIACEQVHFACSKSPGDRSATRSDSSLQGFGKMMAKYGPSLTRLNFGLFIAQSPDYPDYEDFAPFLAACPNLRVYTHGDIALELAALMVLASSQLEHLRIYYAAVMMHADDLARLLQETDMKGDDAPPSRWRWFRELRALHVVIDVCEEPRLAGELRAVETACEARGIEMRRTVPVTNRSTEGSQFVRGFGGIGGVLRYKVDFGLIADAFEDGEEGEFMTDSEDE